jgi:hypothetical protein
MKSIKMIAWTCKKQREGIVTFLLKKDPLFIAQAESFKNSNVLIFGRGHDQGHEQQQTK